MQRTSDPEGFACHCFGKIAAQISFAVGGEHLLHVSAWAQTDTCKALFGPDPPGRNRLVSCRKQNISQDEGSPEPELFSARTQPESYIQPKPQTLSPNPRAFKLKPTAMATLRPTGPRPNPHTRPRSNSNTPLPTKCNQREAKA